MKKMVFGVERFERKLGYNGFDFIDTKQDMFSNDVCIYVSGGLKLSYIDKRSGRRKTYNDVDRVVVHDGSGKISIYQRGEYVGKAFAQYISDVIIGDIKSNSVVKKKRKNNIGEGI